MEREQIIKGLEHCANWTVETGCKGCPYNEDCIDSNVMNDALSLIKELIEENKNLEQAYECADSARRELSSECDRLTKKNERLRAVPGRLHKEMSERMVEKCKIERKRTARRMLVRIRELCVKERFLYQPMWGCMVQAEKEILEGTK